MKAEALRADFPDNIPIPDLLVRLCDYTEQIGCDRFVVGDFELSESGRQDVLAWFDGDRQAADQFVVFAFDKSLSLYGYWRYAGQPLDEAPIVYLDGEAQHNTVLANTLEEFLGLLALGYRRIGLVKKWPQVFEPGADTLRFREWLRSNGGIEPPQDGYTVVVEQARAKHPDLST